MTVERPPSFLTISDVIFVSRSWKRKLAIRHTFLYNKRELRKEGSPVLFVTFEKYLGVASSFSYRSHV